MEFPYQLLALIRDMCMTSDNSCLSCFSVVLLSVKQSNRNVPINLLVYSLTEMMVEVMISKIYIFILSDIMLIFKWFC